MAKVKLDWFKLDCQTDDKIDLVEAEFGLIGFAVVVRLFQKIYGGEGYYCEWNEDVALRFAKKNNVGCNAVSEIVKASVKRGIFDERMFTEFGILTSHGIQSRYFEAVGRRKGEISKPEYLLFKCAQISENADISSENVNILEENADIFSQKRIEKNRGDKKRVYKKELDGSKPARHKYGEYKNVLLSDEDMDKLKAELPNNYLDYIEKLSAYMASTGKVYKSHLATIRSWAKKDGQRTEASGTAKASSYDISDYEQLVADLDPSIF